MCSTLSHIIAMKGPDVMEGPVAVEGPDAVEGPYAVERPGILSIMTQTSIYSYILKKNGVHGIIFIQMS